MWPVLGPAALQVARVHGAAGAMPARRVLSSFASRVVLNRSASCAYRLTVAARGMATAAAKPKKTAAKPDARATKTTATKASARAAAAQKKAPKSKATAIKASKATKTTKSPKAVKSKAKAKAAAPKKKKKAAKVLTPEEKLAADKRKLAKLALSEPPQLPGQPWLVYVSQNTRGKSNLIESIPNISKSYKELSAADIEKLKEIAEANSQANKAAYRDWVDSHTPEQVRVANAARTRLRRVHKVWTMQIKDPRLPKRPMSAFFFFYRNGFGPRPSDDTSIAQHAKAAGAQWKSLSEAERKPYLDMCIADKERYEMDKKSVGLS